MIQLFRCFLNNMSDDYLGFNETTYITLNLNNLAIQYISQAYQTFMKDSAQLFGSPSPEAHKFAVDIFNFEKRIAEITPGQDYLADPLKINNKMKVCSEQCCLVEVG